MRAAQANLKKRRNKDISPTYAMVGVAQDFVVNPGSLSLVNLVLRQNPWVMCGNAPCDTHGLPPQRKAMQRSSRGCVALLEISKATQGNANLPCVAS